MQGIESDTEFVFQLVVNDRSLTSLPDRATVTLLHTKSLPVISDQDGDLVDDVINNCSLVHNPDQADTDGDGVGDACQDSVDIVYLEGWSMISLPVDPNDKRLNKLFPEAMVVYGFEKERGCVRVKPYEDLKIGRGYWILLDDGKSYTLSGQPITSYTYPVSSDGWYMIGGCFSVAQVSSNNCNIGLIYEYAPGEGYRRVTGHLCSLSSWQI